MNKVFAKVCRIARLLTEGEQPVLLSTIGMDGCPRSRYMGQFRIRDTGEIFLICLSNSNKIQEIQKKPQAQVIFSSKDFKKVLTLNGVASVVTDQVLRREIFDEKKPLKLYPTFNDLFGVICFIPHQAEFLDLKVSNDPVIIKLSQD